MLKLITPYMRYLLVILLVLLYVISCLIEDTFNFFYTGIADDNEKYRIMLFAGAVGAFTPFFLASLADNTIGRFGGICLLFALTIVDEVFYLVFINLDQSTALTYCLAYCTLFVAYMLRYTTVIFFLTFIADQLPRTCRTEQREGLFGICLATYNLAYLLTDVTQREKYEYYILLMKHGIFLIAVSSLAVLFWLLRNRQNPDSLALERNLAWRATLVYVEAVKQTYMDIRTLRNYANTFDEESLKIAQPKVKKDKTIGHVWEYTQTFLDRAVSARFNLGFIAHVYHMQQLAFVCIWFVPVWMAFFTFDTQLRSLPLSPVSFNTFIPSWALTLIYDILSISAALFFPLLFFPLLRRWCRFYPNTLQKLVIANVFGALACFGFALLWFHINESQSLSLVNGTVSVGFIVNSGNGACRVHLRGERAEVITSYQEAFVDGFRIPPGEYTVSVARDSKHAANKCLMEEKNITISEKFPHQFISFLRNEGTLTMGPITAFPDDAATIVSINTCRRGLCAEYHGETHTLPASIEFEASIFGDLIHNITIFECSNRGKNLNSENSRVLHFDLASSFGARYYIEVYAKRDCDRPVLIRDLITRQYKTSVGYTISTLYRIPIIVFEACSELMFWIYIVEFMYSQALPALRMIAISTYLLSGVGGVTLTHWIHDSSLTVGVQMLLQTAVFIFCALGIYFVDQSFDYLHYKLKRKIESHKAEQQQDDQKTLTSSVRPVRQPRTIESIARLLSRTSSEVEDLVPMSMSPADTQNTMSPPVILSG